jgi:hypothetical protein
MAGLSTYMENAIIDHLFRNQAFSPPTTLYFALFTAAPTDAGAGTEVSGGSYARVAKTASTNGFTAASGGTATNSEDIDFGTASADWGTVTHFAVFDALTSGNLLGWGVLGTAKTINSGDGGKFLAGSLTLDPD